MGLCLLMRLKPSQRRTHGQGVDQSTILPWGGDRRRRDGEDTAKPERLGKSLPSLSSRCGTLRPLGVTLSLYWPWASGGWHAATPAIHPSSSHSSYTHIQTLFLLMSFFFLSAEGITVMLSSSKLSITAVPTSPVILVSQRLWGVLFSILVHLVQPLLEGHIPLASVKTSFKTLICVRKQSLMNDWCVNADSSPRRENPIVWPKV